MISTYIFSRAEARLNEQLLKKRHHLIICIFSTHSLHIQHIPSTHSQCLSVIGWLICFTLFHCFTCSSGPRPFVSLQVSHVSLIPLGHAPCSTPFHVPLFHLILWATLNALCPPDYILILSILVFFLTTFRLVKTRSTSGCTSRLVGKSPSLQCLTC